MSKVSDNWCVDWDKIKTVYELSDEPCAHRECPYKHCVYHEFYDSDIESIIYTPTTIRELDACMNWLDI